MDAKRPKSLVLYILLCQNIIVHCVSLKIDKTIYILELERYMSLPEMVLIKYGFN